MTGNGAFFRGIVDDIDAFSHALRQFQHAPNAEMTFKSRSFSDVLKQLTLRYLMTPKRNVETDRGGVVDSVANFHMRNGAMIYRVNVLGDRSPKGLRQSYGMMANYLYDLELIEQNREAFRKDGKVVVSSKL